ncbi:hypothetical protein ACVWYF_001440 [Hymenobacter sp. UYAg731]
MDAPQKDLEYKVLDGQKVLVKATVGNAQSGLPTFYLGTKILIPERPDSTSGVVTFAGGESIRGKTLRIMTSVTRPNSNEVTTCNLLYEASGGRPAQMTADNTVTNPIDSIVYFDDRVRFV